MKQDNYQLVCVDFETNGLTLEEDSLAISVRLLEPDGMPTLVEFSSLIYSDQELNPAAIAVNGLTEEQIRSAPRSSQVVKNFWDWYKERCGGKLLSPMGHNFIGYDEPRLRKLFQLDYSKIFHYHYDDSMVIARALRRAGFLKVESCSLDVLAKYFKIESPNSHSASGDTWTAGLIYAKLLRMMNPNLFTRIIRVFYPAYRGV